MKQSCLPHLQLAILRILQLRGPLCGYSIYRLLREAGLDVSEAAVYSALRKLREKKLVEWAEALKENRRVIRYRLTAKGEEALRELMDMLESINRVASRNTAD